MSINVNDNTVLTNNVLFKKENMEKELKRNNKVIYKIIKRFIDIFGGLVGVLLLIPITVVIYIVNLFEKDNKGPLFFDQIRVGKNGKEFKMYKYRSMVMNADEKLWEYLKENEEAKQEYMQYKKLKNDPRITKLGRFLRKTSIDEFPQFINVLKGDMSLVGPRPYLYREKEDMRERFDTIVSVKPGITGYWQVNGRSDVDFEERTHMDVEYVKNRSLWLDFKLLFKTVLKIVGKGEGAI